MATEAPKDQALAKNWTATELAATRPAYLKPPSEQAPRGLEEATMQDMVIPRIVICQTMHDERKKSSPKYIQGLEEGDLFNSMSKERYGKELFFTPLFFYKSRIKFKPMESGGGVECMNPTGKVCALNDGGPCLYGHWGKNGEKPSCDEFYNFPSIIHTLDGRQDFAVISCKRTHIPPAKDLNSKIRSRRADMFSGIYKMWAVPDTNAAGQEYMIPAFDNAGWVDDVTYREAEKSYNAFVETVLSGRATIDTSGLDNEIEAENKGDEPF
jgi:hypothetical protein